MKNATTFPLEIRLKGIEAPLNVFVKLQCGRGAPLWLQAVTKAVEWGMQRESDFYRFLAAHVPLRVPRPYAIDRIDAFNRCCLVLECIEGGTAIADWEGCPLPAIGAMLRNVSIMHAKFLGRTADDAATRWIPAAHGSKRGGALEYVKWVGDLTGDHDVLFKRVWRALTTHPYFAAGAFEEGGERSPLALVHGDCRPGNMLFIGALDRARSPPAVVFADWEAVNVAPPLWDVVYSTTLGIDDAKHGARAVAKLREQYARHLLDAVDESTAAGQQAARLYNPAEAAGRERIAAEGDLLLVVLAFVSYTVVKKNLWNQGNTNDDNIAWRAFVPARARASAAAGVPRVCGARPVPSPRSVPPLTFPHPTPSDRARTLSRHTQRARCTIGSRVFKALRALDSAALATELSRSGTAVDSACVDAVVATLTSIGEE